MRLRKDKGDGDGAASAPPDASTRVEEPELPTEAIPAPPPTPGERVDEPKPADAPAPHGDPLSPAAGPQSPDPGPQSPSAGPQSPSADAPPPTEATRVESPTPAEGAKVLAPDALAQAAPPTAAARVEAPPPQPGELVSAAAPTAAPAIACPQCGSPAARGQEVCIVCGSRIARATAADGSRGWKLPAALAGLGVLLIGIAIAFGVVELTSDEEVKKDDVADLSEEPKPAPAPGAPATPTTPAEPTIPPATREPETPATPDDPADDAPDTTPGPSTSGPAEWPEGKTAFTVVLVSATNRNAADSKAEQAVKRGIEAGVLRSDDFSSLRPGYWVVFAGQFDTSEEATRAADRYAEQGFGGGYPRQVKPK